MKKNARRAAARVELLERRQLLASVTFTLAINDNGSGGHAPGNFAVYADVSSDSGGLASYQVALSNAKTLQNVSPQTTYRSSSGDQQSSAGFTLFRSVFTSGAEMVSTASQNTIDPSATLIHGLGQTSGTFAIRNPFPGGTQGSTVQNSWSGHLLLLSGSYSGATPQFGQAQPIASNVFIAAGNGAVKGATIVQKTIVNGTTTTGSISGIVFGDANKNGVLDSSEDKLASRRIYIDANANGKFDSGENSVLSNSSGVYTFSGLAAGSYRIGRADVPQGYYISTGSNGIHVVNLAGGQNVTNINVGAAPGAQQPPTGNTGSISGRVFNDANQNGAYNAGESLLANRRIYIDANANGKFDSNEASVFSNASGVYTFSGLAAGSYRIGRADTPGGYFYTTGTSGIHTVNLGGGQTVSNIDVGVALGTQPPPTGNTGSISGRVFNDGNKNGAYNAGESLLANRKVFIDSNNNGKFDSGEPSVFTNASGVYTFTGLAAGTHRISRADLPGGYYYTTSPSTGFHVVTLASGQSAGNIDVGVALGTPTTTLGSIGGVVFNDGNKNGAYNAGESLLSSRRIYIDANNNGKLDSGEISTLSNASGAYSFSGLAAGTYRLRRADLPGGYYNTTPSGGVWTVVLGSGQNVSGRDFGAALV